MKTLLSSVLILSTAMAVLAQGKVHFANNSVHLVYWDPDPLGLKPGDEYLAGHAYEFGAAGVTFAVELWAGTANNSLSLAASASFTAQSSAGTWLGENVVLPFPGGTMDFFQILIYDASDGSYQNAFGHDYTGATPIFTCFASAGVPYYFLTQHNSPVYSMWDDGTFNLDSVSPGDTGAIELFVIPEPSAFALSGLGALLMTRFYAANRSRLINPRCST
jgi:hypothetical protein